LQGKYHLKKRRVAGIALKLKRLDDVFQRDLLVRVAS
jgi:hypothetical protein